MRSIPEVPTGDMPQVQAATVGKVHPRSLLREVAPRGRWE